MKTVLSITVIGTICGICSIASAEEPTPVVGVVSLDGERDPAVENEVADNLQAAGFEVLVGVDLAARLYETQVDPPVPAVSSQFAGMTTSISEGVERFFYKGNEAAVEALSPVFDLGMAHPEVLARRPDYADQIFSAGVVLIRAYDALKDEEKRDATTRLLVRTFPSKQPSPTTVPPDVIRMLETATGDLESRATRVNVEFARKSGCAGFVNGVAVEPNTDYAVDASTDYHFRLDCGGEAAPVWRTRVAPGQRTIVPLPDGDPLDHEMADGDFRTRKIAEAQLRAASFWANLDTIVGVSRAAASTDDGVLVVRLDGQEDARWSDGLTEESVQRAIARVFPELTGLPRESDTKASKSDSSSRRGVDVLGLVLLSGGVAIDAVAVTLLLSAQQRAKILSCSNLGTSSDDFCEGIERLDFTGEEYQQDLDAIRTRRTIAWPTLGVGTVMLAYGIVRLVTGPRKTAFYLTPSGVGFATSF